MTTELLTERHGATLLITLSGPATRNALAYQVFAAGIETLNMAESSPDVAAVVLAGAGGHFCSGLDLQQLNHNRHHLSEHGDMIDAFHQWIEALRCFPKPVIAAVEGVAGGSGLSLAMACDLIVAADSARFTSHTNQTALSPDGGLSQALVQALGRGRALDVLWQGQEHSGQQWHAWGLAQRLVPHGQALQAALDWADELAQLPGHVVASIKEDRKSVV